MGPLYHNAYLHRAKFKEPQIVDKELWIDLGTLRYVRSGRQGRSQPRQRERNHRYGLHIQRGAAHLDLSDAGNHTRQTHGDEQVIRSCVTLIINIGAANMAISEGTREKNEKNHPGISHAVCLQLKCGKDRWTSYRRTLRIHSPQARPRRVVSTETANAANIVSMNTPRGSVA